MEALSENKWDKELVDFVAEIWKEGYKKPDDIRDLALSRNKLETDPTEVAEVIDYLRGVNRIKDEPAVPPEGIAKLQDKEGKVTTPPTPVVPTSTEGTSKVEGAVTPVVTPSTEGTSKVEAVVTPVEPVATPEAPTEITVAAYVRPLLAKGLTMVELRQKVGHAKGKPWTAMLDKLVKEAIDMANSHLSAPTMYRNFRTEYRNSMGSIVAAILDLPRNSDGTITANWQNEILCSNPKGATKVVRPEGDKEVTNKVPGNEAPVNHEVQLMVPPNAMVLPQPDGTDLAEAFMYIQLISMLRWKQ